jgi:hypothetical protein
MASNPSFPGRVGGALFSTLWRVVATLAVVVVIGAAVVWAVLEATRPAPPVRPEIAFAPTVDGSLHDPDNPAKIFRVDFARVEQEFPLSRAELMELTPANLTTFSQEEIDQIYGRLTAGPIPDGPHQGTLFFARGDDLRQRLDEILGGIGGRITGAKLDTLERVGGTLWKGKMFDREHRTLRNFIEDIQPIAPLVDDIDTVPTAKVPRGGFLGNFIPTTTVWMLFPAKVYCGQSLVDGRRESIIVDYLYADEIDGYRASPDSLAGRGGMKVRDEIRMIRPGFYLGRAYVNRAFLLNFTLYNAEVADAAAEAFAAGDDLTEDCWTGEQLRSAAVQ